MPEETEMRRTLMVLAFVLAGAETESAKDPPVNAVLEQALRSAYAWTRADGLTGDIIEPGVVLEVRKGGITTNPVTAPFHAQNNYRDGQVKGSAKNIFAQDQATAGRLVAGDRVFVTKTEVKETSVVLSLLSVETMHGQRVKASITFPFGKGELAAAGVDAVTRVIGELLAPEAPAAPESIGIGASVDEVRRALGEPVLVADIGRKLIFLYANVKVVFRDGAVIDVK